MMYFVSKTTHHFWKCRINKVKFDIEQNLCVFVFEYCAYTMDDYISDRN